MTKNIYPANGKFFKLQRVLISLMCILIFASCNFKSKEYKELINTDKELISNDSVLKKNDSLSCLNRDSLRFSELIKLVELNDLTQCEPLIPVKNGLLLRFLNNQNQEIIHHFVEGYIFYFDDGIAGDDTLKRMNKKKNFGSIFFTWSFNREGVDNVLEGRTIALNDIWAREVHLKSFNWVDKFTYKGTYEITL